MRSYLSALDGLLTKAEKIFLETGNVGLLVESCFKRFFQSYSQSFNKYTNRSGNLFYKPYKRVLIENDSQITQTIIYIHANPVKHNLITDLTKYRWSSWQSILSHQKTGILRQEVLEWFGGQERFIKDHLSITRYYYHNEAGLAD